VAGGGVGEREASSSDLGSTIVRASRIRDPAVVVFSENVQFEKLGSGTGFVVPMLTSETPVVPGPSAGVKSSR